MKTVHVEYYTVNGEKGEVQYDLKELMENIFPDMRPPITTISIHSTFEGRKVTVDISQRRIEIRNA